MVKSAIPGCDRPIMRELLYALPAPLIALLLLVSLAGITWVGLRLGRRRAGTGTEAYRAHVSAAQGSLLGLLALLMGFTFSMSLQRYDARSQALVEEANAIGTTWLRAGLLPEPVAAQTKALLRDYTHLRVEAGSISLDHAGDRAAVNTSAIAVQDQLWQQARQAAELDKSPVTSGLYIQALNGMIDAFGARDALLARHVPELVLLLLYGTILLTGAVTGYACGLNGHRPSTVAHMFGLLIVLVAMIIIDVDRPRRGFITVDPTPMLTVKDNIDAALK
jgi:hypothetical protein